MKSIFNIDFVFFLPLISNVQQNNPDSLRKVFQNATTESARYIACVNL